MRTNTHKDNKNMKTFKEQIAVIRQTTDPTLWFGASRPLPPDTSGNTYSLNTNEAKNSWCWNASWGYFSASYKAVFLPDLIKFIEKQFSIKFADCPGAKFYESGMMGPDGIRFDINNVKGGSFRLQIPADYLFSIPPDKLAAFIFRLNYYQPRITRLDLTMDHTGYKHPTPRTIYERLLSTKTYLNSHRHTNFHYHGGSYGEKAGDTLEIGVRGKSEKFFRIYDEKGPTRWECEFSGQAANAAWELFCGQALGNGGYQSLASCVAAIVFGAIGFKDWRSANCMKNPDAIFWTKIKNSLDTCPVKLLLGKKKRNEKIHDRLEWLLKNVSRPLATVIKFYQESWPSLLTDIYLAGVAKMTQVDEALVDSLKTSDGRLEYGFSPTNF